MPTDLHTVYIAATSLAKSLRALTSPYVLGACGTLHTSSECSHGANLKSSDVAYTAVFRTRSLSTPLSLPTTPSEKKSVVSRRPSLLE